MENESFLGESVWRPCQSQPSDCLAWAKIFSGGLFRNVLKACQSERPACHLEVESQRDPPNLARFHIHQSLHRLDLLRLAFPQQAYKPKRELHNTEYKSMDEVFHLLCGSDRLRFAAWTSRSGTFT